MNILFTADNYKPQVNGIVTYIVNLRRELEKRGHRISLATVDFKNTQAEAGVIRIPSLPNPMIKNDRIPLIWNRKTLRTLRQEKFDIVHNHLFTSAFLGLKIAKEQHIPSVVTYHTLFSDYVRRVFPPAQKAVYPAVKLLTKWYFDKFDNVIAPSQKVVNSLKEAKVKTRIYQVNNAINLKEFQRKSPSLFREKFKIPGKYILSVSTLDRGKNVHLAIEAMPYVLEKFPEIKLVVAGEGNERKKLLQLTKKLRLGNNILFTGFLKRAEVASAYCGTEFSLELSEVDTLPTVATEAATTGTPIIALRDDAMVDIVKDGVNGIVIEKPDPNELANAMIKLLSNPKLTGEYSKGSLEIAKDFSIEHYADKIEKIYKEAITSLSES